MEKISSTSLQIGKLPSNQDLPLIDKRILLICQGDLSFYQEALSEINPKNVTVVTCRGGETLIQDHAFEDVQFVDEYFSSGEVEKVCYEILKKRNFKVIVAISETDILRAAKLRDLFQLHGQSSESALFFRDKILMKSLLMREGIKVPEFTHVQCALDVLDFVGKHSYPFIIKPARGYGSLQIRILRDVQDVKTLLDTRGIFDEFQSADLDLEQFIDAEMYHVDGIIRNGQVTMIWPSKCINNCLQMVEGKPTGGYLLSRHNPLVTVLNEYALKVLKIIPAPLDYGFHLELFLRDDKPIFCEVASRIGGPWINDLWMNGMGIDLKREFIRAQAHLHSSINSDLNIPLKIIGGIIFPPRKGIVKSIPKICNLKGVISYNSFAREGEILEQPQGMLGHIAAFTISADSELQMIQIIKLVQEWSQEHFLINAK